MANKKKQTVLLKVEKIVTDRHQYKPYIVELSAKDIFVEMTVEDIDVIEASEEKIILTVDGIANIVGRVADAIDRMDNNHRIKTYGA